MRPWFIPHNTWLGTVSNNTESTYAHNNTVHSELVYSHLERMRMLSVLQEKQNEIQGKTTRTPRTYKRQRVKPQQQTVRTYNKFSKAPMLAGIGPLSSLSFNDRILCVKPIQTRRHTGVDIHTKTTGMRPELCSVMRTTAHHWKPCDVQVLSHAEAQGYQMKASSAGTQIL